MRIWHHGCDTATTHRRSSAERAGEELLRSDPFADLHCVNGRHDTLIPNAMLHHWEERRKRCQTRHLPRFVRRTDDGRTIKRTRRNLDSNLAIDRLLMTSESTDFEQRVLSRPRAVHTTISRGLPGQLSARGCCHEYLAKEEVGKRSFGYEVD